MKKGLAVAVGALATSLLFSGCFMMRTLTYTKDKVDAGEKTTARVTLHGSTGGVMTARLRELGLRGGDQPERPFFLLRPEGYVKLAKGGVLDTKGVFDGPVKLNRDSALAAIADQECGNAFLARGVDGPGPTAVRTAQTFDAPNGRKIINAKLALKVPAAGEGTAGAAHLLTVGSWYDDGDGVPEDPGGTDDSYQCSPPYTSTVIIKGPVNLP
jgi:hypothetical protein